MGDESVGYALQNSRLGDESVGYALQNSKALLMPCKTAKRCLCPAKQRPILEASAERKQR
jgi:hypothetical protein